MNAPTLIDLFCGAGGISHGFEQVGFAVLGGSDLDEDSIATFRTNHPGAKALCGDLSKVSPRELAEALGVKPGEVDCVAGGPPCQGFSRNRAFRHDGGRFVDDARNHLYWHFFEFVDYLRPKVVLMENVPEILIKANGYFRDAVFERFERLGYNADAKVLNAAEFGVPQRRRRAIFLAGRDRQRVPFPEPTTSPGPRAGRRTPTSKDYIAASPQSDTLSLFGQLPSGPTVWEAISDLHGGYAGELGGCGKYATSAITAYQRARRGEERGPWNHFPWPLRERQLQRIKLLREGEGHLHLPEELQPKEGYGSAYRRMQRDALALTITTWMFHPGSGMFTHPIEDRVVTIREAARLQSFDDSFRFQGRYHSQCRQVGNAVAPQVAANVARSICKLLGKGRGDQDSRSTRTTPDRVKNSMVSSKPARLQSI